ncbi:MAG: DUF368 domain-containing protein [Desulfovibrionaceae bacterium]
MERLDLRAAWAASTGPRTLGQGALLALKGFCMGSADIIPGVSGGTVAFITGIYEQLLAAIKGFDAGFFAALARLHPALALARSHLRFLLPLLAGLLCAVVLMSRLMHHLMTTHPVEVWSFFFGLIAASILVVGARVGRPGAAEVAAMVLGTAGSWLLVGVVPVATPEAAWFVFLCGALAVCAMILPGISGAYILLLLGKYEFITGALKNPFADGNLLVLCVFVLGCGVGIMSFARALHWALNRWHGPSVALLTGFMLGALRKVWPWKEVLETRLVAGRDVVVREANVLPPDLGGPLLAALGLMALGFALVVVLERLGRRAEG